MSVMIQSVIDKTSIAGMQTVRVAVDEFAQQNRDLFVNPARFGMVHNSTEVLMAVEDEPTSFIMSDWSLHQYLRLTNMRCGMAYVHQCKLYKKLELLVANLNAWNLPNKQYLIRLHSNKVRGLLTTDYASYSNGDYLDTIEEHLLDGSSSLGVTDFTMDEQNMTVYVKENASFFRDFNMGMQFNNSEVGRSSAEARICLITPKKSCLVLSSGATTVGNGKMLIRQRHVGSINMSEKMGEFVSRIPEFADYIQKKIKSSSETAINVEDEIAHMAKAIRLSEKRQKELTKRLNNGKISLLDYLVEISVFALDSDAETLRSDIESYAGSRLERA